MAKAFAGFDWSNFWDHSDWSRDQYEDVAPTQQVIREVEARLGYTLPQAYVEFCHLQNGGTPRLTAHKTDSPTSWAADHIAIAGIFSIGENKRCSLCGEVGSAFWISEWEYPRIGIYFADCPSAGHDMLCLDYRECGPHGEPRVVHVDQEDNYKITAVAPNFEALIRGLVSPETFDIED